MPRLRRAAGGLASPIISRREFLALTAAGAATRCPMRSPAKPSPGCRDRCSGGHGGDPSGGHEGGPRPS